MVVPEIKPRQRPAHRAEKGVQGHSHGVFPQESAFLQSLGPRGFHVGFVQLIQQIGTGDADAPRRGAHRQDHHRLPHMLGHVNYPGPAPGRCDHLWAEQPSHTHAQPGHRDPEDDQRQHERGYAGTNKVDGSDDIV